MNKTTLTSKNRHPAGFERVVLMVWIFILGSLAGFMLETAYHLAVFHEIQNRSGLLLGPFSPIYGCGAVVTAAFAPWLEEKPFVLAFLVTALSGGAVEYAASWLMESAFGIAAWDYSGTFLSIDGRTNGAFMATWGMLGMLFVKALLPLFNDTIRPRLCAIPMSATCLIALFMALDVAFTVASLARWEDRQKGLDAETPIQKACDLCFDETFMSARFETMGFIDASLLSS